MLAQVQFAGVFVKLILWDMELVKNQCLHVRIYAGVLISPRSTNTGRKKIRSKFSGRMKHHWASWEKAGRMFEDA